ncbi:MAG: GNAT family N-acetyltransferase [Myxococcales bacterium]|nr:GNAT family N-acetyltransferase [Myxococcales bacterium]
MTAALRFKVLRAISAVSPDEWARLHAADAEATPFQKFAWLDALERSGAASPARGWHPFHLTAWRGETLVGAAPAYLREDSSGEFVFDFQWAKAAARAGIAYYPKLLIAVPFTPATGRRVLVDPREDREAVTRSLLAWAVGEAQALGLSSVHMLFPTEDELGWALGEGAMHRAGVQFHWQNPGYARYDDFLARFDAKRRHQLRREARAPHEQGLTLRTRRNDALSVDDADRVHTLYCTTVDKFAWGQRYLNRAFFADVLGRFREHLELVEALDGDGRVIASAFNVASETHLYGRYWGCFEERPFLHFNVCYYHSIGECIARGVKVFEGGAGGEHKVARGFEPCETRSAHWVFHRGLRGAIDDFVSRERAAIRAELPSLREAAGLRRGGPSGASS